MSDALIQIVDENDQPLSAATIDEAQTKGLIHRIVRIMIEDTSGKVLLQKRLATQKIYPNCWDNSAAGHVDAGETYKVAAARELAEEIGLTNLELKEISYYPSNGRFKDRLLNRFNKVYKAIVDPGVKLTLQADEVADAKWFTVDEVKKLITDPPNQVTDGVIEVFERYY